MVIKLKNKQYVPLNSNERLERCGEVGSGKLGIGRDLNVFLVASSSTGSFLRSIVPLRSVLRANALGYVIFGGADLRSREADSL